MKRNKQVRQTHFQHHSYLDDEAVIAHANEASNSDKFKKLFASDWEDLYGDQSDADMALPVIWHSGVAAMRSRWIASSVHRA